MRRWAKLNPLARPRLNMMEIEYSDWRAYLTNGDHDPTVLGDALCVRPQRARRAADKLYLGASRLRHIDSENRVCQCF